MKPKPNPQLLLRVPDCVGKLVTRDAKKRKLTRQAIILEVLGSHYAVAVQPPKRGRIGKSGSVSKNAINSD
jgi:D-alanyl-D-alanine carboxypeptidase